MRINKKAISGKETAFSLFEIYVRKIIYKYFRFILK